MSSKLKAETNRANAQKSTGPKTPEGKAASSQNALKHGLSTTMAVLDGENKLEYLSFSSSMAIHFTPVKGDEEHLLQLMIDGAWRLRRASQYECRIFEESPNMDETLHRLNLLSRYEVRIANIYFKSRTAFAHSQTNRVKQQSSDGGHIAAHAEKFDASKHIPRLEGFDAKRSQLIASIDQETEAEYDRLDAALAIRTNERRHREEAELKAATEAKAKADHLAQLAEYERLALKKAQELGFVLQNTPTVEDTTRPALNSAEKPPQSK